MSALEKQPRAGSGWEYQGSIQTGPERLHVFLRDRFRVISCIGEMELPQSGGLTGPTWHVSIARRGRRRPSAKEVARALRDFDMSEAEEDNHMPGLARHFFMPLDPRYRGVCECKTTEEAIVEGDGFRWQNATDGSRCGGCSFERIGGKPCPVHAQPPAKGARWWLR